MSHFHKQGKQTESIPETEGKVIRWAWTYDTLFDRILRPSEISIRDLSKIKSGDKVLDVGCGSGRLTIAAQKWAVPAGEVYGFDPSPEMIKVARFTAQRLGSEAKFEVGQVESIPFPDATFDVVLNRLMMHHLPGDLKQRGLAEMRRVLKPGGICLIIDFEPPKSTFPRHLVENLLSPVMVEVDVRNYVPLLTEAGFIDIETGPTNMKLLSFARGVAKK